MTPTLQRALLIGLGLLLAAPPLSAGSGRRLVEAARAQDGPEVRRLVAEGADVTDAEPDGTTALHWATHWSDRETVALLIDAGADVNTTNAFGATPLWVAASEGRSALVADLLEAGADPNRALRLGETPLMSAARAGSTDAVRQLLEAGAHVDATETARGQSALMWAVSRGHHEVVRVLIDAGADVSARSNVRPMLVNAGEDGLTRRSGDYTDLIEEAQGGFTPLLFAVRQGDLTATTLLLDAGADIEDATPMGTPALVVATHSGRWAMAELLLDRGADPNGDGGGYAALHAAIFRHHPAFIETLLSHGADPDIRITQATPIRRFSHDYAVDPSWSGGTAYWLAAKLNDVDLMRTLADAGARLDVRSDDGATALIAAAAGDRRARQRPQEAERRALESIRVALTHGAAIDATNARGETAMHIVAARRLNGVVEFLAAEGARLDLETTEGLTPLALASQDHSALTVVQFSALRHRPTRRDDSTAQLLRELGAVE